MQNIGLTKVRKPSNSRKLAKGMKPENLITARSAGATVTPGSTSSTRSTSAKSSGRAGTLAPKPREKVLSEHVEQAAFCTWVSMAYPEIVVYAVPNAARRSPWEAEQKRAEGMLAGVPDVIVDDARGGYFGLRLEFKRRDQITKTNGGCSEAQLKIGAAMRAKGYCVLVVYGNAHAQAELVRYMGLKPTVALPVTR